MKKLFSWWWKCFSEYAVRDYNNQFQPQYKLF